MLDEIFPVKIRGIGVGFGTFFNWLANFLVALTFPMMLGSMETSLFIIYAIIGVGAFIFVRTKVIETSNHSLEKIEEKLRLRQ